MLVMINYGQGYYDVRLRGRRRSSRSSSQGLFTDGGSDVKVQGAQRRHRLGHRAARRRPGARSRCSSTKASASPTPPSASIEPLSIFGPKFVDIDPGEHEATGPFLAPATRSPTRRTSVELTQILDSAVAAARRDRAERAAGRVRRGGRGRRRHGRRRSGAPSTAPAVLAGIAAAHGADTRCSSTDVAALSGTVAEHADDILATVDRPRTSSCRPSTPSPDRIDELLDVTTEISTTFNRLVDRQPGRDRRRDRGHRRVRRRRATASPSTSPTSSTWPARSSADWPT